MQSVGIKPMSTKSQHKKAILKNIFDIWNSGWSHKKDEIRLQYFSTGLQLKSVYRLRHKIVKYKVIRRNNKVNVFFMGLIGIIFYYSDKSVEIKP